MFQGLRSGDAPTRTEAAGSQAVKASTLMAPELEERTPVQNIHEAADAEELLKEIDACGVRICICVCDLRILLHPGMNTIVEN